MSTIKTFAARWIPSLISVIIGLKLQAFLLLIPSLAQAQTYSNEVYYGFNLYGNWTNYLYAYSNTQKYSEAVAGNATFWRPTVAGVEGSVIYRFPFSNSIVSANLTASIAVWTTGDAYPYDPGAKAYLDVSPDGTNWTTLDGRYANHGGGSSGPYDITANVLNSKEVWVRARLTGTVSWYSDGLIFAQFLRIGPGDTNHTLKLVAYVSAATNLPPSINAQPASTTATVGDNVSFIVSATGAAPLKYQWRKNGVNLSGETNTTLVFSNVQTNQAGGYQVLITNAYGSVTSSVATLTVNSPTQKLPRPNTFMLMSIQAGSTTDIDNLRVVDLDAGAVIYTNSFNSASDATNNLNLFYYPQGDDNKTNFATNGSMTRIVSGKLRLETTGFGANGSGGYNSHSEAEFIPSLPKNFLVDFDAIRLQWAGHFRFYMFYRQPFDALSSYNPNGGAFSTNRSPALRLDVLNLDASGNWFNPYGLYTNAAYAGGWAIQFPPPAGSLQSTHRLGIALSNSVARFYLDGVLLNSADISQWIEKTPAVVTLTNLMQTHDGTAKCATATTAPPGLSVGLTYNGSSSCPTNAGSYTVIGTISDANYAGSATNTLVIEKTSATVTLGNLAQTYNGAAKCASATTTPSGLTVNLTYNGSAACPTNAGSYTVVGTIIDANYQGSATTTLVIAKTNAMVILTGLNRTYNGAAQCVSAHSLPSNLVVTVTYNGSPACPTNPGSYTVIGTINATNYQGSTTNTLVIGCPTISLASLPPPALGVSYSAAATAGGSFAPYTYGLIAGTLPPGLTLDTNTGTVSGLPSSAGTYAFTLQATGSFGCAGMRAYSFTTTCPELTLSGLPEAYLGIAYNQSVAASGGAAPYAFALSGGTLPSGLSLATNGVISGTPTTNGVYAFSITATDIYGCPGSSNYTVTVGCPTIALAALPDANLGVAYNQAPTASGGVAPYTYGLVSGTLPAGLSFATNGSISGLPLAFTTNSLTITATDANGCTGSQAYTFAVTGSGNAGDTNKPSVTITSPANNSTVTNASLTVTGVAADSTGTPNTGVALVFYSLNGGASQLATGTTSWNANVNLAVGTNILVAQAVDYQGNVSALKTNKVFYAVRTEFTVVTNGVGKVVLSPAGTVYVGRDYTFTLTPSAAVTNFFLLSNIVNEASSGVTVTKFYKYTFRAETTNRITINFVTNRFTSAAGMYQGLFAADPVTRRSAGMAVLRTQGKATYSGYLKVAGDKISVTGVFDLNGEDFAKTVFRPGKGALNLSLRLNFDDTMWGTISCPDEGWSASLEAYKSVFTAANPATNYTGKYNIVIPGRPGDATMPAGAGSIQPSISTLGAVSGSVTLADNQKFTSSAVLSKDGQWPFFVDLGRAYPGIIIGWLQFSNNAALAPVEGNLFWVKESGVGGYYDAGFTNSAIAASGSVFIPGSAIDLTNSTLVLADGNLAAPLSNLLVVTNGNKLQMVTTNGNPKLTYYPTTGLLLGTFNHPVTGQLGVKLHGVYVPGETRFHGYFLGTNQSGSLLIEGN